MKSILLIIFLSVLTFALSLAYASECNLQAPIKTYQPRYAKHFAIKYYKNFKIVNVNNDQYLLSENAEIGCTTSLLKITTPVKKVVMMSTTYLPALELLHQEQTLIAFQGKNYIVSKKFNLNQIKDLAFKYNPEFLLGLKSDLIMGYASNLTSQSQRHVFNLLKLAVVFNKDFEESTSLGRAEWLVFISSFYNQEIEAENIFNSIEKNYLALKEKNKKIQKKAKVLVGEIQGGYWVTCGGKSDLGQLIEDAGGEVVPHNTSSTTQKINLEEMSKEKTLYDIWLTHNFWENSDDLALGIHKDSRYLLIKAKNIFNNNLITNGHKANDFWETGLQRPDLLLLDLSSIFHPELFTSHKLYWYRKL
ncbi:MAG: ABC transporter substrate-binding protein [Bacteriovorax sp.]|nr:ABC transporter substrate-binding protein [Bacteriovorax sp.]